MDDDNLDLQAQQAAEAHLEACYDWLDTEGYEDSREEPDMAGPFCGCLTCQVRETLHAAYPFLRRLAVLSDEPPLS